MGKGPLRLRRACGRSPTLTVSARMTHIHDSRIDMVVRFVDVRKRCARKALGGRRIKSNGHPQGWPSSPSTVRLCVARVHLHHMALWISERGSSNAIASIVGGALQRIFQLLRDEIDHHIPSCTAVVWKEEHTPNHKAAKACIHRDQVLRLILEAWQDDRSLPPLDTPTRGSIRTEICRAF